MIRTRFTPPITQRERRALDDGRPLTGIQVEHHHLGRLQVNRPRHRRVEFERCEVRGPREACPLGDQAVLNRPAPIARASGGVDPAGPVRRTALLEERRAVHPVGEPTECHAPVAQVRQHRVGDAHVVVDDLGLRESRSGVEHLVEIGEPDAPTLDGDLDRFPHQADRAARAAATDASSAAIRSMTVSPDGAGVSSAVRSSPCDFRSIRSSSCSR